MNDKITIDIQAPGLRPRKPPRPRKPRKTFVKTEVVWTSEEDDILLADLLHLIPSDIKAQKIRISVERNPANGYPHTTITYNREAINTRYNEQLIDYEQRMEMYEQNVVKWRARDKEWCDIASAYEAKLDVLRLRMEQAFNEHDNAEEDVI